MRAVKIYALIWLLVLAGGVDLSANDLFSPLARKLYGFVITMLFCAGIMLVLPLWFDERSSRDSKTKAFK